METANPVTYPELFQSAGHFLRHLACHLVDSRCLVHSGY